MMGSSVTTSEVDVSGVCNFFVGVSTRPLCTQNTSSHAHFSQSLPVLVSLLSVPEFVSHLSSLFHMHSTCVWLMLGLRLKAQVFFMIDVSCAHPIKTFSIHTSCVSLLFRLCVLSARLHHHPGHLLQRRQLESDQTPVQSAKRMDILACWPHDIPPHLGRAEFGQKRCDVFVLQLFEALLLTLTMLRVCSAI